ncbi:helix-turn-helix transcriptional regulator [Microbacterium gilvum]|uniref:helix-turn-helix transcriptional regulator n=1 Tax=Microbacterium gilvum TaxID=1336204 RepID=UPI0031E9BB31
MTGGDPHALEHLLATLDWRLVEASRPEIDAGGRLALPAGETLLVYVAAGSATAEGGSRVGCAVAEDAQLHPAPDSALVEGDALIAMGRADVRLESSAGASLVMARLRDASAAAHLLDVIPDVVSVYGFAALEPTAAALAATLGPGTTPRSGDPVICGLMATTVVLALLRAWTEAGCAPAGWPARSSDPHLAHVLEAIHRDPGRSWTLDALAAMATMSRTVFAERFRAATGAAPLGYVTGVRMAAAKALLAGATVSETSRALGYGSDEGFSRAFRRHTGMTPTAWRAGAVV